MIRVILIVIATLTAAVGLFAPEEASLNPISIIIYLIAAALFAWLVMQIWHVAGLILKFAVTIACIAFLGIALLSVAENMNAKTEAEVETSGTQTETSKNETTSSSSTAPTINNSTSKKNNLAASNKQEKPAKEQKITSKEKDDLSFFQRLKRKFFISNDQVEKAIEKRKKEEAQQLAQKKREQAKLQEIAKRTGQSSPTQRIKEAVRKNQTPLTPSFNIVYDKKGTPIGKIDNKGLFTHLGKEEAAELLKMVESKKSQTQAQPIKQANVSPRQQILKTQATKIKNIPNKPEPVNPKNNAYNPPPEITPSSDIIKGIATAISGDTISINDHWITLFAIDAPHKAQTCTKFSGELYSCGMSSKRKLELLVNDRRITCKALARTISGDYLAVCSDGQNDIGATMVRTGWALAYRESSDVYVPYELHAQREGQGIWQGRFKKPWEFKSE
ncbi:MAG: hypothetical protein GY804_06445 [Alphaproteobacteria bacterium]|nr:hypothetical protein [Alphaproteobacteria bacterium]